VDTFSTRDAARKLGIAVSTLSHYMAVGKVPAPKAITSGGMTLHLWTEAEIEEVRKLLPKLKNGRKKPRRRQEKPQPKKK
jgi:predicted DNA-binding transcriptional regulator AlpA